MAAFYDSKMSPRKKEPFLGHSRRVLNLSGLPFRGTSRRSLGIGKAPSQRRIAKKWLLVGPSFIIGNEIQSWSKLLEVCHGHAGNDQSGSGLDRKEEGGRERLRPLSCHSH